MYETGLLMDTLIAHVVTVHGLALDGWHHTIIDPSTGLVVAIVKDGAMAERIADALNGV